MEFYRKTLHDADRALCAQLPVSEKAKLKWFILESNPGIQLTNTSQKIKAQINH